MQQGCCDKMGCIHGQHSMLRSPNGGQREQDSTMRHEWWYEVSRAELTGWAQGSCSVMGQSCSRERRSDSLRGICSVASTYLKTTFHTKQAAVGGRPRWEEMRGTHVAHSSALALVTRSATVGPLALVNDVGLDRDGKTREGGAGDEGVH